MNTLTKWNFPHFSIGDWENNLQEQDWQRYDTEKWPIEKWVFNNYLSTLSLSQSFYKLQITSYRHLVAVRLSPMLFFQCSNPFVLETVENIRIFYFLPVHRNAAPSASPSGGNTGAGWRGSDTRWSWAPSSPKWHPHLPAGSNRTKTQQECCTLSDGHSCTPALQGHYSCSAKVKIYSKLCNKTLSHSSGSKSALGPWTGRETQLPRLANHQQRTRDILKLLMATLGSWNPQG